MLLESRTQWSTLCNSHGYSNRQTKWSAYMYSDICMCVLYTYAAVKRFLIWWAGPDESNGIFFFCFFLSWFRHSFILFSFCRVHKDSPAGVAAYDCMNVLVRIVWVCICASVEFPNNPNCKKSKHAGKAKKKRRCVLIRLSFIILFHRAYLGVTCRGRVKIHFDEATSVSCLLS